jgi:hypothetical protein
MRNSMQSVSAVALLTTVACVPLHSAGTAEKPGSDPRTATAGSVVPPMLDPGEGGNLVGAPVVQPMAPEAAKGKSSLVISVAWPRRVAALPLTANSVRYSISSPQYALPIKGLISRADASNIRIIDLDPASVITVTVSAHAEESPAQDAVNLATGTATASVPPNMRITIPITLQIAQFALPGITSVDPSHGGPGVSVSLSLVNVPADVSFNVRLGATAASHNRSGQTVTTTVPASATSGAWGLLIGGVEIASSSKFSVLKALTMNTATPAIAQGDAFRFGVTGTTTENSPFESPRVTWGVVAKPLPGATASNPIGDIPIIDNNGGVALSGNASGDYWVQAFSGTLAATAEFKVLKGTSASASAGK